MADSLLRVLQVLWDTDRSDVARRALDRHVLLGRRGLSVRTVALGPGRRGGLDDVVPTLAPSPRTPSARTQLRRERGWADVVVLHGAAVDAAGSLLLRGGPPLVALVDGDLPATAPSGVAAVAVTVPPDDDHDRAPARGADLRGSGRASAPAQLLGAPVLRWPLAVDDRVPVVGDAARTAARVELGLAPAGPVVRLVGDDTGRPAAADVVAVWREAVAAAGGTLLEDPGASGRRADAGRAELVEAAVDVVVAAHGSASSLPGVDVLDGALRGRAVVAAPGPEAALLGPAAVVLGPGGPTSAMASLGDPAERRRLGALAADVVRRRCPSEPAAEEWERTLRAVAGR